MTKKLLFLLLSLAMVASLVGAAVSAAGGETNASFTVSKETVEVGEEVVVVLSYNDMTVSSFACGFFFDKEKFECKSIVGSDPEYPDEFGINKTSGKNTWVAATAYPTAAESNGTGTVGFVVAGTDDVAYAADVILTATFVAKAAGTADFVLYEDSDGADGFKSDDAATKTVTITEAAACEHEYFYPCDPVCMKCYELTNPEAAHSMKHVEAVAATCTENGNVEHWTCEYCGGCWDNENATGMPLNKMMVVVPAAHTYDDNCDFECNVCGEYRDAPHNLGDKIEAKVPANCQETGYDEHWICADCGGYFMDNGMGGYYETNPAWMNYPGDHVRPADAPDCAVVPCTLCGEDSYGEGTCDRGDVPVCQDAVCSKCNGTVYGWGCNYNTGDEDVPAPLCQPGKCVYCGTEYEKLYDCENGSWATCLDGECSYGCGKKFPATTAHEVENPCAGGNCSICWSVIEPAHSNLVHFDAVAPGCHYNGNIEYWVCYDCEGVWQNAELTQVTNIKNVVLPALGGEVAHIDAVAPGCHYEGNIEYWSCATCEQVWQDEALTQLTNIKNVVLPATGGEVVHVEAVAPGCHYTGNIEYWVCYNCEKVWQDEALTQLTNIKNVVLPALGGEVVHVEAKAPTCYENGNIEHWYCETCEQVWQNAELTQLTNFKNVVVPTEGHTNLVHVDAVAPGCHYDGNIEYWICYGCETVWQDEALTQLTNIKNVVLPATGGDVVHMEAVAPGCHYTGNIEYWVCYNCEQVWQDEALTQLTNIKNVVLPALGGDIEHVDAKAPTCSENGNIEHWYCKTCEQVWQDEALTQLTNFKNVVVPATGEHQYFYACDAHCMSCGELTNPEAAHKLTHVAAKAPTCYENGNIEYWTCEYCGACWDNENTTGVILNRMNVILPMAHKEATHVEAKAPTCLDLGNLEYWYCEACGQAWLDADCTLNTNLKAVILPLVDHKIVHVEAKAPTATENGNLEYWYCEVCGFAWLDEACTRNTNLKAVILPATGSSADTGDKAIFFAVAIVAVATVGAAVITFKKKREN